jgi:hypothetical protein
MSPEISQAIYDDFTHLTTTNRGPDIHPFEGFAIADGWEQLLRQLLAEIEHERLKMPPEQAAKVMLTCVKEKWGVLRVYVANANDEIRAACDRIEEASFGVCEECGATGDDVYPDGGGWIRTLCPSCRGGPPR